MVKKGQLKKKRVNSDYSNSSLRGAQRRVNPLTVILNLIQDLILNRVENDNKSRLLHGVYTERSRSVRNDTSNAFAFLFLFFLPTQLGKHFFFPFSYLSGVRVDYLAPTIFVTDILAVTLIVLNWQAVIKLFKNKWLAVFLLLLAIGGLFAQSGEIFLYRFVKILELIGVFAVFKYKKPSLNLLLSGFLLGALLQFGLVFSQFLNKQSLQGVFYWLGERYLNLSMPGVAKASLQGVEFLRPYGTFPHPNSLAGFYLVVYAFFAKQKLQSSWLKNSLLVASFLIILLSFSKTALAAFFILQLFYLKDEFKSASCIPCIISKVLLFTVPLVIFATAQTDPLSLPKRYLLMQNALALIAQNLLLGVGLGNYLIVQTQLPTSLVSFPYQPVHNIFLLFVAETGLLTLGLVAYLGVKKFFSVRKNVVFVGCCLVLILTGLLDHYWLTLQQNWLLMGVIFGALAVDLRRTG